MLKILIADDHEVVRRGLKQILQEEFTFAHFEEAADTSTLINKALGSNWDLILSDLTMPGGGGLDALRHIRQKIPAIPVLIISLYPEEQYALRVIKAGAAGYLNKDAAAEKLVKAVYRVLSGGQYITDELTEQLNTISQDSSEMPPHEMLSEREFHVLKLIATGSSNTEIAEKLSLGSSTVSTYRSRILSKMNRRNNAELIQYAIENKLI